MALNDKCQFRSKIYIDNRIKNNNVAYVYWYTSYALSAAPCNNMMYIHSNSQDIIWTQARACDCIMYHPFFSRTSDAA